jgi:hypothetical protein
MKTYLVTASLNSASCYNKGYQFEIIARNATEAVQKARRDIVNTGHTRQDGGLTYKAVKIEG